MTKKDQSRYCSNLLNGFATVESYNPGALWRNCTSNPLQGLDFLGEPFDVVFAQGVQAKGRHGVYEFERLEEKLFRADVKAWIHQQQAGLAKDISKTVSYGDLARIAEQVLQGDPEDLLETIAEEIAARVISLPGVRIVEVTVYKPEAPLNVSFREVGVSIKRVSNLLARPTQTLNHSGLRLSVPVQAEAIVACGSNLGKRKYNICRGIELLNNTPGVEVVKVAPMMETKAIIEAGAAAQRNYKNTVALIRTTLSPLEFLLCLQQIEVQLGRKRVERWGARTLDLDVVTYKCNEEEIISEDPQLTLPHPRARERDFVLKPWLGLDPQAEIIGQPVLQLLQGIKNETHLHS